MFLPMACEWMAHMNMTIMDRWKKAEIMLQKNKNKKKKKREG